MLASFKAQLVQEAVRAPDTGGPPVPRSQLRQWCISPSRSVCRSSTGRPQKDPEWMLVHGASADRYLETVGRSISELSRRQGSSSRPFVADALSWCSTNQPASTRLPAPRWRVVHWTAGDGRLVPASRVAWVRTAATRDRDVGSCGVEVMLVACAGSGTGPGVEELSCWSRSSRVGSDSLAVRLGEHSSRVPCQPPGGTRRPNRLVESRVEPLVRTS
jgi:hypothetical protein